MQLTGLDFFLWVAGFLGNVTLLVVLWKSRRARRFPTFTTLITFNVCRTLALFFIVYRFGAHQVYFYVYWTLAIVDIALQFAVLYEATSQIFCPSGHWSPGVRRTFLWIIAASAICATALAWLAQPREANLHGTIVVRGNFSASVLMSELFVGMIVLSVTTGLPWRTHVARIVQGLGVNAILGIVIEALQSNFGYVNGTSTYTVLSRIQIGTYIVTQIFWIITMTRDAPQPRELPNQLQRQLLHLNHRTSLALDYLRLRSKP